MAAAARCGLHHFCWKLADGLVTASLALRQQTDAAGYRSRIARPRMHVQDFFLRVCTLHTEYWHFADGHTLHVARRGEAWHS